MDWESIKRQTAATQAVEGFFLTPEQWEIIEKYRDGVIDHSEFMRLARELAK